MRYTKTVAFSNVATAIDPLTFDVSAANAMMNEKNVAIQITIREHINKTVEIILKTPKIPLTLEDIVLFAGHVDSP